ncbi:MAG: DUF885 domain-containing protein, partial [Thermoplasmata archaeon]|nr:DUF885 domain-containing protein [Thermoplasmata archaeon]
MGAVSSFDKVNEDMLSEFLFLNPEKATMLGIHDPYDYQMPHGGPEHIEQNLALLKRWSTLAHRAARRQSLSIDQSLSLEALDMAVDRAKFYTDVYPIWRMNPDCLSALGPMLLKMATSDYAPLSKRLDAIAWRLSRLGHYLSEFRTRFDRHHPVEAWTDDAIVACELFPKFLDSIEMAARKKIPDRFLTQLKHSTSLAEDALDDHLEWLRDMRRNSVPEYAMGTARFEKLLELRRIGLDKAQVLRLGEAGFKHWREEMDKTVRRLSPKGDFQSASRLVASHSPRRFEDVLKAAQAEVHSARAFVEFKGFATVPPEMPFTVSETPDFMAPLFPYGNLYMSTRFDRELSAVYYFTRPKARKDIKELYNRSSVVTIMCHCSYPGHFLQRCASSNKPWMFMLPEFAGSDMLSYGWGFDGTEGWACSANLMMYENRYKTDDEVYFQIAASRLMYQVGALVDVKLACGEATVEEYVDKYAEMTGIPRLASESNVRWTSREPGATLSYATGVHQFAELRTEISR